MNLAKHSIIGPAIKGLANKVHEEHKVYQDQPAHMGGLFNKMGLAQ
jgi:hypothetical protein